MATGEVEARVKRMFYSLVIIFIILTAYFLAPALTPVSVSSIRILLPLTAILGALFLIQGLRLTFAARRETGRRKLFFLLTGIAAAAPLPLALLHNLFDGLAFTFKSLKFLFGPLQVAFFIAALVISPLIFLVGVIGSLIVMRKTIDK